jgi:hemerythrin-like domain-containing protein
MPEAETLDIAASAIALGDDPLRFFLAEHQRHRQFCRVLNETASTKVFDEPRLRRIIAFLRHDMALHFTDEEQDLFPLLRLRATPEDDIDLVLERLSAEHGTDLDVARNVRAALEACIASRQAPGLQPDVKRALEDMASKELQHLALENAVVLPIARLRLTANDLTEMASRLAARRTPKSP